MEHDTSNNPEVLSCEAFIDSGWQEAIADAHAPDCWAYWPYLYKLADDHDAAGRAREAASVWAVAKACHLALAPDDDDGPFAPTYRGTNSRSTALEDITEDELNLYADLIEALDDQALQARLGDILWCRRRNGQAARRAAAAYLATATTAIEAGRAARAQEEIRRALDLAVHLGRQNQPFKNAVATLHNAIHTLDATGNRKDALFVVRALLHHRAGDISALGQLLEEWAEDATGDHQWIWAQHWWNLAARCAELRNDQEALDRIRRHTANTFVSQANEESRSPDQASAAAHWLQAAITTLQAVKGTREERDVLTERVIALQETAVEEMGRVSHEIDLTSPIKNAIARVTLPELRDAIVQLATLHRPPSRAALDNETRELNQAAPLSQIIPRLAIDRRGRVRATSGPLIGGEGTEESFRHRVIETATFHQQLVAVVIARAAAVIDEQHALSVDEFLFLVHCSPFVPPGREYSFARGLYVGARGDYLTAAHLLLPQLEHALRYLLNQAGAVTLTQDRDGIQKERNLSMLLAIPLLNRILDEQTVFDLQCLLVEPMGGNLRNDIAHGLRDDHDLDTWESAYAWWSVLRLCVLTALQRVVGSESDSHDAAVDRREPDMPDTEGVDPDDR